MRLRPFDRIIGLPALMLVITATGVAAGLNVRVLEGTTMELVSPWLQWVLWPLVLSGMYAYKGLVYRTTPLDFLLVAAATTYYAYIAFAFAPNNGPEATPSWAGAYAAPFVLAMPIGIVGCILAYRIFAQWEEAGY